MTADKIKASAVRFIKLGGGGGYEKQALEEGRLYLGYHEASDEACREGDWDAIQQFFLDAGHKAFVASNHMRQVRDFYEQHANKAELLVVLDRPEVPLNTNGSENDIRACVTRRKISAGTRSEAGKQARDIFLGLMKTCKKLDISFWHYLGNRLKVPDAPGVMPLPILVRQRCQAMA